MAKKKNAPAPSYEEDFEAALEHDLKSILSLTKKGRLASAAEAAGEVTMWLTRIAAAKNEELEAGIKRAAEILG